MDHADDTTPATVPEWDVRYRAYQTRLAERFLLPVLRGWGREVGGARVLEVGAGDGGCAAAFARAGARVATIDVDARLVGIARELDRRQGVDVEASVGDVCDPACDAFARGPYDLVLLRDVVEHLEDLPRAMENVRRALAPAGAALVVFPPYYSPYGAHQQILPRRRLGPVPVNRLPYVHLLPDALFLRVVRGDTPQHREVVRLRGVRLTLGRFERTAREVGFVLHRRRWYLSRPTYALRYGFPVVGAGVLGRIPGVRELVVTAGYYLITPARSTRAGGVA